MEELKKQKEEWKREKEELHARVAAYQRFCWEREELRARVAELEGMYLPVCFECVERFANSWTCL